VLSRVPFAVRNLFMDPRGHTVEQLSTDPQLAGPLMHLVALELQRGDAVAELSAQVD
jgi:hypothetical protein